MAAGSLQVGQRFTIDHVPYRLARRAKPQLWVVEDLGTGRFHEETTSNLLEKWSAGNLRFNEAGERKPSENGHFEDAYRQSYPEALWKRAQEKLRYIRALVGAPITESIFRPLIQEVWEKTKAAKDGPEFTKPPHFTSVVSWIRAYRNAGNDVRALIEQHQGKGNRKPRKDEIVEEIAQDLVEKMYLTLERPPLKSVHKELRGRVAKINLSRLPSEKFLLPSFSYLKRKVSQIPPYERDVARYGKRIADIKYRAAGRGPIAEKPLARASIDHCRLDLMVVDEETGLPLGRPWLTLILDECTRYVLGFYLGFEEPSAVSVARALRNAIMPKTELLKAHPEIVNAWDAWGVVELLVADNGMELHARAIEQGAGRFGIQLQFCPRRKPWYKGKIERFFLTINTGLLGSIPGKTFSSILSRGDYNSEKNAVVGLSTLRKLLPMWLVDVYHQEPHRGLGGERPARLWDQRINDVDRWLPASSLAIESAFGKADHRILTHKGIEYDCLFYNSNEMRSLRQAYGSEIEVEVRVMDDDLGSIIVVDPDGVTLIRVAAIDQEYAHGLTRWQHAMCKRYRRRLFEDEGIEIGLLEARERIRELIRRDMGMVKRGSRKKQARFVGEDTSQGKTTAVANDIPPRQESGYVEISEPWDQGQIEACDDLPDLRGRRISPPQETSNA